MRMRKRRRQKIGYVYLHQISEESHYVPNKQSAGSGQASWIETEAEKRDNERWQQTTMTTTTTKRMEHVRTNKKKKKRVREKYVSCVCVALAEAGQRTGMGDIAATDEKTLFSEAYLLHKISMRTMKRTAGGRQKKQTNSMWSNSF